MKKYRTGGYGRNPIEWKEAKDFLLKNAERKVERFNVLLSKAEKELASIKALERTSEGVKEDGRS